MTGPQSEIYSRYLLSSRQQQEHESVDDFMHGLELLAKECTFVAVSAQEYRDEFIRDSFIRGLKSSEIRKRLLDVKNCTLPCEGTGNVYQAPQRIFPENKVASQSGSSSSTPRKTKSESVSSLRESLTREFHSQRQRRPPKRLGYSKLGG